MNRINPKMQAKMKEALVAVLPIVVIVLLLSFTIAPLSPSILLSFLLGSVLVMVGMMFFTLGAEISMTPMGEKVGAKMTQSKKVWLIVILSFVLMFLVPADFRAIAFDSGGVASGPMTATFLLPLAQGACVAVGGNLVADAFGVVAMVAMTPLITIQIMGVIHQVKNRKRISAAVPVPALDEDAIIEL